MQGVNLDLLSLEHAEFAKNNIQKSLPLYKPFFSKKKMKKVTKDQFD